MGDPEDLVALVSAMPSELSPIVRALRLTRTEVTHGGAVVHQGRVGTHEVLALRTGIGPTRAGRVTAALLAAVPVTRVVVSGIAGGIAPHTRIGDLVVPAEVVDGLTGDRFTATGVGAVRPDGVLRTGDVDSYEDGDDAFARDAADGVSAVDMETAAIARACEVRGVPWLAFRAISDMAGDPGIGPAVMDMVDEEGRPRPLPALRHLVTHPHRIPRLVRLGRDASRAARTAADAAVATL